MSVKSSQGPDSVPPEPSKSQNIRLLDFDLWASQVRRQMVASLKKRTLIYGDFWANSRTAKAKSETTSDLEN